MRFVAARPNRCFELSFGAPYELIKRASRVYNVSRGDEANEDGDGKIGNRGSIRAMSDSKHMDARVTRDSPNDGSNSNSNSNTCYSLNDHRAKYFYGLKNRAAAAAHSVSQSGRLKDSTQS